MADLDGWEMVIGLEVHCELATRTKLFCGCPNLFGDEPNTNVCPVCLGLPGSLPVLNEMAVELAIRLGQALHCTVERSVFARKNYFYPDMPKDYPISQYDLPTNVDGHLDLPDGTRIGIERAHIEEDTGKSAHVGGDGRIHGAEYSLVDYNRAGIPLVEIVSRPDLRSADDAKDYVNELRAILLATAVSDAKMEEGSMRVDANVSVRPLGDDQLGTRCEIKNLNSVRSLVHAIEHEAARQVELIGAGERVRQETRHWDEAAGRTRPGRSKEQAEDYRYFPEPDLVPLEPDAEYVARIAAAMPLLPGDRRARLASVSNGSQGSVAIAVTRGLDELAIAAIEAGGDPVRVLTHVEHNLAVEGAESVDPAALAKLTHLELTATQAKAVLADLVKSGGDPEDIAKAKGFEAMDASALDASIEAAITAEPDVWAKYVGGDDKAVGRLVGSVMKATNGQADGKAVTAKLQERRTNASG
ncbi:MAG: aspartyl-tRNA(Asn)/glutamyl-tRNA(Gln) amidotransferase subunit [Acidimicrobiaceae bacterium]